MKGKSTMAFKDMLKTISRDIVKGVADAKDNIAEKSRKSAVINRLRSVVKLEEARRDRAYMALGRYYYHNLRDENNENTEPHCAAVDEAESRIAAALAHLDELYHEKDNAAEAEEIDLEGVVEIEAPAEEIDPVTAGSNSQYIEIGDDETAKDGENDNLPFE